MPRTALHGSTADAVAIWPFWDVSVVQLDVDARPTRSLYRAVWRWHFYAGLFAIPVIVMLCLTGIVYLFKPQLNTLMYGDLMKVTPGTSAVSYEQQRAAVLTEYPEAEIAQILTPEKPNRSTQFGITTAEGKSYAVWVDPYTGEVLGHRDDGTDPAQLAKLMHGTLLTGKFLGDDGKWGDRFIELVAGWSVVLVITGLYLWWPRGKTRWRDSLKVRRASGPRMFWRDLHAVTGVLFSFVMLFFLITGLAWSGVWGAKFNSLATDTDGYYNGAWDFSAESTLGELQPNGASPWAASNLPMLASRIPVQGDALTWDATGPAPIDAIVRTAQDHGLNGSVVLTPPGDEKGSWFVGYYEDTDAAPNRSSFDQQILYVDQYSAKIIDDYTYGDYGATGKAMATGISLHEGREWGLVSQIGVLIATLALLLSVASSLVMWRKRRPKGIGSPRKEPDRRISLGVLGIMAVLGFLFPLVGLSMVVLLVIEFVLLRRVPPVARALGLAEPKREKEKV